MKPLACAFASLLIALTGCTCDHNDTTASAAARRGDVEAGMTHIVPVVDFRDVPLDAAIDKLRAMTGANIVVAWKTLESAGIERTTPVNCHLTNLPLSRVLELTAAQATTSAQPLGVRAQDRVIVIDTAEALSHVTETRTYDVSDLVEHDRKLHARWNDVYFQTRGENSAATQPNRSWTGEQSLDSLKKSIADNITPNAWRDAGGEVASMEEFDGKLIITASVETHAQIAALLEKLRKGN